MSTVEGTLVGFGAACIIAALVGGGMKAFGAEIPRVASIRRQVALGIAGVVFMAIGFTPGLRAVVTVDENVVAPTPVNNPMPLIGPDTVEGILGRD